MIKVATSIVLGNQASPELAAKAVTQAMHKAGITIANSVLLMLTSEFASDPQPAIKAAAKAANCLLVMGCTATGIFTEEDWVLDTPAAAVMVFGDEVSLRPSKSNQTHQPLLTLSAPNAINSTWLNDGNTRFGGVSGDAIGQGYFTVWQDAKGEISDQAEAFFTGVKSATKASHGLKILTPPQRIDQVNGFDITQLSNHTPLTSLQKAWKACSKSDESIPLHQIMAIYAHNAEAINNGDYMQTTPIAYDELNGSITLAQPLEAGQFLSWGLRDKTVAEADMTLITHQLRQELATEPDFGLLFSSLGRGPYLYDGIDRDLKVITQQLPNMPLLGFYGNGEISSVSGENQLLPHSAVLALYAAQIK
jgi:small ligand-binding sensory domain FIST